MTTTLDPIAQKAVAWMVQIHSGELTELERQEFETWRAADVRHDQACRRLEQTLGVIPQMGTAPALRSALQKSNRRQFLGNALALSVMAYAGGWLYNRNTPITGFFSDLSTGTAQRQTTTLSDGSVLILNARSIVDIDAGPNQRRIDLLKGQIHVAVSKSSSPLLINTGAGQIRVESGKLVVSSRPGGIRVAALSASATLLNRDSSKMQLSPGTGAMMTAISLSPLKINPAAEVAWINGFIEIDDQPLSVLVDALRDYRTGVLRISPEASVIRISGLFPLDNSDFTLEALAQTFPVVVTRTTDYWVSITSA